ncbi:MAG: hypothetical protein WC924_04055 [Candidatus Gracilibacteria bacterium]
MAIGDTSSPEASRVEPADDAVITRADRQITAAENDNNVDRAAIRTRIGEIDKTIKDLGERAEKARTEGNSKKAARLTEKQADLYDKRAKVVARYEKLYDKYDEKADVLDVEIKKITDLKAEIAALTAFISANKGSANPDILHTVGEKENLLADKQKELTKLTGKGREQAALDKRDALRKLEKETRAEEHPEEDLEKGMAAATGDKVADKTKEGKPTTSGLPGDAEAKAARKQELLGNALGRAAYGLAVELERSYPGKDGNAYEKMMSSGKAFLVKALIMFGGTPAWAELLNPQQKEFLDKKVGVAFMEEPVKKDGVETGEKQWTYKWTTPEEDWEPGIIYMEDVLETAYGKEGVAKAMEGIKTETTLAQLKATAPASDISPTAEKTRKLVTAMEQAGADAASKVQEFLIKNTQKVQSYLAPSPTDVPAH